MRSPPVRDPLQPSINSAGHSFLNLLLCCSTSRGCNMVLLWFPNLSRCFILFSWITSLMNGTCRSTCRVWLDTYQGALVIIRNILDWLRCNMAMCDLLAHPHKFHQVQKRFLIIKWSLYMFPPMMAIIGFSSSSDDGHHWVKHVKALFYY
jgi:hypothetical protein